MISIAGQLVTGGYDRYTGRISSDGRLLAFVLSAPIAGSELWTVPLQGRASSSRYLANGFNLAHPAISPDGRWMAYDSDESGRVEVYAQSFPNPGLKRLEDLSDLRLGAALDPRRARTGLSEG